jgi:hypothetical protein
LNSGQPGEISGGFGSADVEVIECCQALRRNPAWAHGFEKCPDAADNVRSTVAGVVRCHMIG